MTHPLPIDGLRAETLELLDRAPLVISSPTGSGKSTQVPRWLRTRGRVLVIEPRRVACRSLASFVAKLEGSPLGRDVGYVVRGDRRATPDSAIVFATPGVVLRWMASGKLSAFDSVIIDEFHERGLDVDLLLALLLDGNTASLVVMSATLDGERIASHLGGRHLHAEGRQHPVAVHYLGRDADLPQGYGLESRLQQALERCRDDAGDILVFLPGKGEIFAAESAVARRSDLLVLPLHGRLPLKEQSRIFAPSSKRKLILATNVAETSLTIDGVGVVIDSGLVRQTRYFRGRGYLGLAPIAQDSAEQRRGRAGRTAAGICYRLWSARAQLEERTPPEIQRESLVPLVLAAAASEKDPRRLPFLDPPPAHALEEAERELAALGALDPPKLSERGRHLFGLPLDAGLGRLLVEARGRPVEEDMVDLVAALSIGRPIFRSERPRDPSEDLRRGGCDGVALVRALRVGLHCGDQVDLFAVRDARKVAKELRKALGLSPAIPDHDRVSQERLALCALRADPRCAHIRRRRRKLTVWSPGGSELKLARHSAVDEEKTQAIAVVATRALDVGHRELSLIATCALPLRLSQLAEMGLGELEVAGASIVKGRLVGKLTRRYAGMVIGDREEELRGRAAREAVATLFAQGRIHSGAGDEARLRIEEQLLLDSLIACDILTLSQRQTLPPGWKSIPIPETAEGEAQTPLVRWLQKHLEELGVESWEDLQILDPEDLLPPAIPDPLRASIQREWPLRLTLPGSRWRAEVRPARREVDLWPLGQKAKKAPSAAHLPHYGGFKIYGEIQGRRRLLRSSPNAFG